MQLHKLKKTTTNSKKRLGRGYGSGKGGHTVGRGQKGQKTRSSVPNYFVGTSWVWFKRLPFLRGKSRFNPLSPKVTLTLSDLNKFKEGSQVTRELLYQHGFLNKTTLHTSRIKLVNSGKLEKKLTVQIPATSKAVASIKKAGGEYRVQAA